MVESKQNRLDKNKKHEKKMVYKIIEYSDKQNNNNNKITCEYGSGNKSQCL